MRIFSITPNNAEELERYDLFKKSKARVTASRENRDVESTTAGALVTIGPKRLVNGPCWESEFEVPSVYENTKERMPFPVSLVLFQVRKGMSVLPLEKDMFVAPVHSVFVLLEHSCTRAVVSCYS